MNDHTRTTRQQFLGAVRNALGRAGVMTARPAPPLVDTDFVRLTRPDENLPLLFAERAGEVGMSVHRCRAETLIETLIELLAEIDAKSVTTAFENLTQASKIGDALRARGVEIRDWRNDPTLQVQYEVDAGITDVHGALAETGTIICNSSTAHGRGHSLAPPAHIAIVRQSDILADMIDYMAKLRGRSPADLPSAQAMITGPSKTADIEGVLITGVHGPGKVFVLLVEDA